METNRKTKTKIMAVLNLTPDSFSDGGRYNSVEKALAHAESLVAEGADILDVGGESTRPFATAVSAEEELRRTINIVAALHSRLPDIPISIDTMKAEVAREALAAGASIINDISACRHDENMAQLTAETGAPLIIMHMQGTPRTMQVNPCYDDVVAELLAFFGERIDTLLAAGVKRENIILDPGIGFGKRLEDNLMLIKHLDRFAELGQQVLLAHSRKSFLGAITGIDNEMERDFATAVVSALAVAAKPAMVRVHNVARTKEALLIAEAVFGA